MKKFRLYYDKDKETQWLQHMANQGWALETFFLGVYTFVPCEPGEYRYQIDFLENGADFEGYRQLMEDSGVYAGGPGGCSCGKRLQTAPLSCTPTRSP